MSINPKDLTKRIITEAETLDPDLETKFKNELDTVMKDLPSQLRTFAAGQGDKDGQLDVVQINQEAVGIAVAGALWSMPAIIQGIGKLGGKLGKKLDSQVIQDAAKAIHGFGHKWHHAYEKSIYNILKKLAPQDTSEELLTQAAQYIMFAITITLGIGAFQGAISGATAGQTGFAAIESALGTIKGGEAAIFARSMIGKVLATAFA